MTKPELLEEIRSLELQLESADKRCDEAWKNWDQEAYEDAVDSYIRIHNKWIAIQKEYDKQ